MKVYGVAAMTILIALFLVAWVAASVLGTMAYFLGEQSKPIHERNWRSESFERISEAVTGAPIDYTKRVPAFISVDAYSSSLLPNG